MSIYITSVTNGFIIKIFFPCKIIIRLPVFAILAYYFSYKKFPGLKLLSIITFRVIIGIILYFLFFSGGDAGPAPESASLVDLVEIDIQEVENRETTDDNVDYRLFKNSNLKIILCQVSVCIVIAGVSLALQSA